MGLWQPGQLIWLILAALVPLLYWGIRRRVVDVSSHIIWQRTGAGQSAWRRWQQILSVCIVAGLLAALAVFLAEPYWRSDRAAARTIVVVLDPTATQGDARQSAVAAVDGMKLYERMAIVSASEPTRVLCPFTDDRAQLMQAINAPLNIDAPSAPAGKKLAEWMLAAEQNPTVMVCPKPAESAPAENESNRQADPPGVWILAGALAVCATEWVLFTRRVTV